MINHMFNTPPEGRSFKTCKQNKRSITQQHFPNIARVGGSTRVQCRNERNLDKRMYRTRTRTRKYLMMRYEENEECQSTDSCLMDHDQLETIEEEEEDVVLYSIRKRMKTCILDDFGVYWSRVPVDMWYEIASWIGTRELYTGILTLNRTIYHMISKYLLLNSEDGFMRCCVRGDVHLVKLALEIRPYHPQLFKSRLFWYELTRTTFSDSQLISTYKRVFPCSYKEYLNNFKYATRETYGLKYALRNGHAAIAKLLMKDERCQVFAACTDEIAGVCQSIQLETLQLIIENKQVDPDSYKTALYHMLAWGSSVRSSKLTMIYEDSIYDNILPFPTSKASGEKISVETIVQILLDTVRETAGNYKSIFDELVHSHNIFCFLVSNDCTNILETLQREGVQIPNHRVEEAFPKVQSMEMARIVLKFVVPTVSEFNYAFTRSCTYICLALAEDERISMSELATYMLSVIGLHTPIPQVVKHYGYGIHQDLFNLLGKNKDFCNALLQERAKAAVSMYHIPLLRYLIKEQGADVSHNNYELVRDGLNLGNVAVIYCLIDNEQMCQKTFFTWLDKLPQYSVLATLLRHYASLKNQCHAVQFLEWAKASVPHFENQFLPQPIVPPLSTILNQQYARVIPLDFPMFFLRNLETFCMFRFGNMSQ